MSASEISTVEYADSIASTSSFFSSFCSTDSIYKKQISVHDLSIGILYKIFSYFSEMELYECLSRVCRKWKFAVYNSSLRKDLHFIGNTASTEEIFDILRSTPNLQSVTFDSVPDIKTIIRQVCRYFLYYHAGI